MELENMQEQGINEVETSRTNQNPEGNYEEQLQHPIEETDEDGDDEEGYNSNQENYDSEDSDEGDQPL